MTSAFTCPITRPWSSPHPDQNHLAAEHIVMCIMEVRWRRVSPLVVATHNMSNEASG